MNAIVTLSVVLGLSAQLSHATIIAKYYPGFNYEAQKCSLLNGQGYWTQVPIPGSGEAQWTNGPRGKRDRYCIEYVGTIVGASGFLWADADDGVLVLQGNNVVINKWNSYDPRGCQNAAGCPYVAGPVRILYYQDYGQAHLTLKTSASPNGPWTDLTAANFASDTTELAALQAATNTQFQPLTTITSATCCFPNQNCATGTPNCNASLPWVDLGRIGSVTEVYRNTYWNGRGSPSTAYYYINQCTNMLYVGTNGINSAVPNGDNIVLQVTIGNYTDYFKPIPNQNLTICDMLMNNRFHMWSKTGQPGTFIQPVYYYHEQLVGGSDDQWPRYSIVNDSRQFLPFWGGNGAYGACCHAQPDDQSKWNREATLKLRALPPGVTDPVLPTKLVSWTQPVTNWTKLAWVSGRWNTGVSNAANWVNLVNSGIRDSYAGVNGGVYFFRSCGTWNSTTNGGMANTSNIIMALCMSPDSLSTPQCTSMVDYFRPIPGKNLCDMLTSNSNHNWFYNTNATSPTQWLSTPYVVPFSQHFGGSKDNWPARFCQMQCNNIYTTQDTCALDNKCLWNAQQNQCGPANGTLGSPQRCTVSETRTYLPFWGGNQGGHGRLVYNGSRTQWDSVGQETWQRDYYLYIAKMEP